MNSNPDNLDPIIHQPTRLRILSTLAGVESMDFTQLKAVLALTDGNLSTHLGQLEKAGYVRIAKGFRGKKPLTTASMTGPGRDALSAHIAALQAIIDQASGKGS